MSLHTTPHISAPVPHARQDAADRWHALCGGAVRLPGDPGYDDGRRAWNAAVDQRPAAVAYPVDAEEVAAVVRAATAAGLRVAPQGTGHNARPLPGLDDAVLLRTSAMTGVTVDPQARRVRVGAGTLWLDVVEAVSPHGLAALHGSSPDVGVVGYSLGGGIGWYARRLGLAANSITAAEIVTASGELVRTDASHEPDLFWALRGGGGNLGVVTALEFALYPIETAYAGALVWDWQDAERVLTRWSQWAREAPDEVTTSFRILQLPPIEAVPAPLRGRQVAMVDGAVLADDDGATALLAPLRELRPEIDLFTRMPAPALVRLHGDPEGPTPAASDSSLLGSLPSAAVEAFVAAAGPGSGSTLLAAELRQLGGALGRRAPGGGVLDSLEGEVALFAVGLAADEASEAKTVADAGTVVRALEPWSTGRQYLNFAETPVDPSTGYTPDAYARLQAVRAAVDPSGLLLANHAVPVDAAAPVSG